MRAIWLTAALGAVVLGGTQPSFAVYEGPWCMHMSMGRAGLISKCDMPSYEACRAEMRSMGGTYCTQNPYYWWNAKAQPSDRKARRRAPRRH